MLIILAVVSEGARNKALRNIIRSRAAERYKVLLDRVLRDYRRRRRARRPHMEIVARRRGEEYKYVYCIYYNIIYIYMYSGAYTPKSLIYKPSLRITRFLAAFVQKSFVLVPRPS